MQEVLLGGRGQQKRHYAVDDSIYGTEEGAKLQKEAVDGSGKIIKKRKKKKKRKDKNDDKDIEGATLANDNVTNDDDSNVRLKQSVAGVVVAGTLAAGISMFLGGGKRSQ